MNRYPSVGEIVEVTRYIDKDLEDDKVGKVVRRNGEYIYVQLALSGVEIECYINELKAFKVNT